MRTIRALTLGTLAGVGTVTGPASAFAGPPSPTPVAAAAGDIPIEPVPIEPVPFEPLPVEPSPRSAAPVELPHFESSPATATQPSDAEASAKPTPLPVPRDGKGSLAFGGLFMVGGAITTGLGIGAFAEGFPGFGIVGTTVGVHGLGVGLGATLQGVKRQRNHRKWLAATHLQPPRSGLGLLGAGTALMMGSVGVLLVSVYAGSFDWETTPWWGPAGIAAGSTGLAIGATTLVVGSVRHHRFERWRAERGRDVLPSVAVGPHGVYIGLSGRL